MKKVIIFILACIMILSLCACSDESESSTPKTVAPEVMADIVEQNPLLISMGSEITINGKTYTAAMLYETRSGDPFVSDEGTFVVNRINGRVSLRTNSYTSNSNYVTAWLDTGLVYEGTVDVAGVKVSVPECPNPN